MIGIIGAMEPEVEALKETMTDKKITNKAQMEFYHGNLWGAEAVVVRSGIGKVNAAICAQILADDFHVDVLINTGVAGSLHNEINIGDIVLSTDALQHDMDAVGFGYALGQIPQMEVWDFPGDRKLLSLAKECCAKVIPDTGVFEGRIVTGDQFISSREKKEWIKKNFAGYCTEMEGAAIAQAAYLNHIPCLIIRAISDKADDSAQMVYSEFLEIAVANSIKLLKEMLQKLSAN
ncbi:MAG: 5'-methylthioadenosine/adenosylhomocysteine nucleosidase [Lachnospiraceae bacterium]|nr:5'-methylthioadenosine/adenosylhomocysteine nucleosidase [Lachnospiraceae bacterium]